MLQTVPQWPISRRFTGKRASLRPSFYLRPVFELWSFQSSLYKCKSAFPRRNSVRFHSTILFSANVANFAHYVNIGCLCVRVIHHVSSVVKVRYCQQFFTRCSPRLMIANVCGGWEMKFTVDLLWKAMQKTLNQLKVNGFKSQCRLFLQCIQLSNLRR